jgi:putative transcriptional regulator
MTKQNGSLANDLIEALTEAVDHANGKIDLPTRIYTPPSVDVRAIRQRFDLSRARFAARFGLDARALQEWEQGRRAPDRAARILLKVIELKPEIVEDALRDAEIVHKAEPRRPIRERVRPQKKKVQVQPRRASVA